MRNIYLTINDGPTKNFRDKIDFLKSKNITAVFFCIGLLIQEKYDDIIYAIKNDFVIGNHSFTHCSFNGLNYKTAQDEISKTDDLIEKLYKISNKVRKSKLFRYPYGINGGDDINKYLKENGYQIIDWNYNIGEVGAEKKYILDKLVCIKDNDIILMHDVVSSHYLFKEIINRLIEKDFKWKII